MSEQQEWPPNPDLVVDAVVFANPSNPHVLLIQRRDEPFQGHWALPGGYVEAGEWLKDAAIRELAEETGVSVRSVQRVGVYDDPRRDPRGHVVSVAFATEIQYRKDAVARDDAAAVEWVPLKAVLCDEIPLAFDHRKITAAAARMFDWNLGSPEVSTQVLSASTRKRLGLDDSVK
ncbi:8-oxo-dGTP diphosphatase [Saccharopolyspora antimicrobica]|uniref:8-oxo-dGTP diphosphatase n=1 Tax=Saccharopolyspora antimicrobica TaxID=455193 RepID=A0A1I4QBQ3_9PSEU|nr:NUDIX hydrolase [Saccharopolyspora antimicrobica]RKT84864.1 8-oxo-dGTP diphosphatase [Saccharopolyspora antimicrobica]SFM37532.1 8-oxo-dGTP diphosphatase [Saccharopolyspora antimicrobica]